MDSITRGTPIALVKRVLSSLSLSYLFLVSRYCLLNSEKYMVGRLEPTIFVEVLKDMLGLHEKEAKEEREIVGKMPTISAKSLGSVVNVDTYVNEFMRSE